VSEQLSWAQQLILNAATQVAYLPFRAELQINVPYGVWRSLKIRGLLRPIPWGWKITERGRQLVKTGTVVQPKRKEEPIMNSTSSKLRYRVARTLHGWAVIDCSINKIRMHNDVVETFSGRDPARLRARELNQEEQRRERLQQVPTGDAA
jgi:hypothetical protein